jgi:hypothetical protein
MKKMLVFFEESILVSKFSKIQSIIEVMYVIIDVLSIIS